MIVTYVQILDKIANLDHFGVISDEKFKHNKTIRV